MEINSVSLQEIDLLKTISEKTFSETFSDLNSVENMQDYFLNKFSVEQLTLELKNKNSEFYFIKNKTLIMGYLKVNFKDAQTEIKDPEAIEIERIYVLKEFHGKKIGQHLFNKALNIAKKHKSKYLWLGVWEENFRALNFYKKNGFIVFDKHIFKLGNDDQTDLMMRLEIN